MGAMQAADDGLDLDRDLKCFLKLCSGRVISAKLPRGSTPMELLILRILSFLSR